ncbi:ribosome assembly cofactor RimP [Flavobacterium haoranii]|uniref:Ribosome maturation factor RimP n=1 Tax=Flavobacterium haoranii TaxID=683124 RepID=A0A1M6FQP8_9FLAO|nr:ribosome assembly cofactor RimP [Flavobacterium haoranii]MDK2771585.1 ribosome assembly cofactor RimP [Flavobacterium sp.]SHJ00021.1 ribosome maturation factor RimP [Flavobacterium haoranii]
MLFKEKVNQLVQEALMERPSLFLIDLKITDDNKISVILDGDNGVNLQDCIDVSRVLEHNLDREEVDFALEVASAGATSPMKMPRQYKKNIGRKIKVVKISDEVIEATLIEADENGVTLEWKAREPKKIGKGKETVDKKEVLPYTDIKQAVVIITF